MKKNVTKTATSGNTLEIYPMEFDLDYYIFIILIVILLSIITLCGKK
jgi:hypothetical protein